MDLLEAQRIYSTHSFIEDGKLNCLTRRSWGLKKVLIWNHIAKKFFEKEVRDEPIIGLHVERTKRVLNDEGYDFNLEDLVSEDWVFISEKDFKTFKQEIVNA